MDPLYLTRKEIGNILAMSEKQAREILMEHGVHPIDLGKGRGHGLRWRTSAVIRVADTLHAQAQEAQKKHKRSPYMPKSALIKGRSAEELFKEFNSGALQ